MNDGALRPLAHSPPRNVPLLTKTAPCHARSPCGKQRLSVIFCSRTVVALTSTWADQNLSAPALAQSLRAPTPHASTLAFSPQSWPAAPLTQGHRVMHGRSKRRGGRHLDFLRTVRCGGRPRAKSSASRQIVDQRRGALRRLGHAVQFILECNCLLLAVHLSRVASAKMWT